MTVYYDMMFLFNFIVDYLVIYSTSKLSYLDTGVLKKISGAAIGAFYGIFVFEQGNAFNFFGNLLTTLLILYVVFKNVRLKTIIIFYIISFLFGGVANFLNNLYGVIELSEGFFYVENNVLRVVFGIGITAFIIVYAIKIIKRNVIKKRQIKSVEIVVEGKRVEVKGLLDTGNMLIDPITQYPVILVLYDTVKDALPEELKEFLKEGQDISSRLNRRYMRKIRLIPVRNSGYDSILKGFKPDYIVLKDEKEKIITDVVVAVTHKTLSYNNEFNAILNPQL